MTPIQVSEERMLQIKSVSKGTKAGNNNRMLGKLEFSKAKEWGLNVQWEVMRLQLGSGFRVGKREV